MKVCFLLGTFAANGGIGRVTSILASRIADNTDTEVFTLCYSDRKKPDIYPLSDKIHKACLMENHVNMTKFMLTGGIAKLRKYFKENDIDIVVACGSIFYPIGVLATRGVKTKSVCWEHSDPSLTGDFKGQKFMHRFGVKRADLNVVITKAALNYYVEKLGVKNTVLIYNPVDSDAINAAGSYDVNSKKILSVGRLSYNKNFIDAVRVAAEVFKTHPDWSWDICGDGAEKENLKNEIKRLSLDSKVNLLGQVENMYERYSDYAFVVMTSRCEGFPMILLEGMANALPLVSYDIKTGPDEIIDDGINGFLCPALDINYLKDKVEELIVSDTLRLSMSENSKKSISLFSEESIINKWYGEFKSLI